MMQHQTNRYYENRYKFTGKELDEKTGLYDFGARHYNPSWGVWLSVDPMAVERSWLSPYNYVQNNPIVRVDPTGAIDNPIYDKDGNFLGTDDKGLQGEAIVMDRNDFKQGMSHKEAMRKNVGVNSLKPNTQSKLNNHFSKLPNRIDYSSDFVLTKGIADKHWQSGTGEPLFVNMANIELPGVTTASFDNKEGLHISKNFIWGLSNTGKVYGTLKLTLEKASTGTVHLGGESYMDQYDFKMDGRLLRNFATWWGRPGGRMMARVFSFMDMEKQQFQ